MTARQPRKSAARAAAPVRAPAHHRATSRHPGPPLEPPGDAWAGRAAAVVIGVAVLAMAGLTLLWHPVGDYFTESDFYEYARGGSRIGRGLVEPGRYGIIGPLYEFVLALVGRLTAHVFRAATLLSVASAATVMACWYLIAARRVRPLAGLCVVVFLGTNPVFFRYGYSANTDLLALALQSLSLQLLLAPRRRHDTLAGAFAGLAVLTRYVGLYLLPAAAVFLLARRKPQLRRLLAWALGLALSLAPWTAYSLAHGHVPAEGLVHNFVFYSNETAARNVQDLTPEAARAAATTGESLPALLARRVGEHAARDARELLGLPLALLTLLGLALAFRPASAPGSLPVALHAGAAFALLLASFYSDRYSLTMLPAYLVLAALPLVALYRSSDRWRAGATASLALTLLLAGSAVRASWALQSHVHEQLPVETLDAAAYLRGTHRSDLVIIARKAAVPHFAHAEHVPFPKVRSLAELAELARRTHATHLFYSWYEGELRPEFWHLLDSTTVVPGLRQVFKTDRNAAILYAIEDGFGTPPAWYADSTERYMRDLCGSVRILPDSSAGPTHRAIGISAARRGSYALALDHFTAMTHVQPSNPEGWTLGGYALLSDGRPEPAREWFTRALQLAPGNSLAAAGLGRTEWKRGRKAEAARLLRPLLAQVRDPALLVELGRWYAAAGDAAGARECAELRAR